MIGAVVLGIGRALGETIAVAMVSGNNTRRRCPAISTGP